MLNLEDVLEDIVDRFNQRALAQHQFVPELHQPRFHIFSVASNQCQALVVELLEQLLRDIAPIAEELAEQTFAHLGDGFAVVNIACRQFEGQELASVIDNQMQLEAVVPAHRVFAPAHQAFKDFMGLGATRMTDFNRGGIDEANASDFPSTGMEEAAQQHQTPGHQFDKAVVADQVGKGPTPEGQDLQGIEILEGTTARSVEGNDNRHHFTEAQTGAIELRLVAASQLQLLAAVGFKALTKIVHFPEQLANIETRFYFHG